MIDRRMLRMWVLEALRGLGGSGSVLEVSRRIWETREADLRSSGDLFYTWQYDVRWQAQSLRNDGYLKSVEGRRNVPWELTGLGWEVEIPSHHTQEPLRGGMAAIAPATSSERYSRRRV